MRSQQLWVSGTGKGRPARVVAALAWCALASAGAGCTGDIGTGSPPGEGGDGGSGTGGDLGGGGSTTSGSGGVGASSSGSGGESTSSSGSGGSASSSSSTSGSGGSTSSSSSSGGGYDPVCLASEPGGYCGNDMMQDADPDVLYQCPGANQAPTGSTPCPNGCVVEQQGVADHCAQPPSDSYRLPWKPGVTMTLTQDCFDSCCNDHVADDGWAWDFANGTNFTVVAARGGVVTHLKINSTNGCGSAACVDDANFIVIDHGDGTHATYLHLQGNSLKPGVSCGGSVTRGQELANAGSTGWSTGTHLHFQVSEVHAGAPTCECGSGGMGCAASSVPWGSFWSTTSDPTLEITFDEWPQTGACNDRYMAMPASQNQ